MRPVIVRTVLFQALALAVFAVSAEAQQPAAATGCQTCHASQQSATLAAPARDFAVTDVHRERGFSCVDCHGGDPAASDKAAAKAPSTGFRGKPTGALIIAVCSRCHSDAALMRKYAPKQRVDQAAEYATSVHGQQLAKGDTKVATCVSCHGAHGVRPVGDAQSPVYPLNVADADGKPVTAESKYVLHFSKDELPPVDAFWSLTMYDAEGFQVPNRLDRFAIGDRDALKFNADGSLELYIQNESPGADKESNWLPAPKSGQLGLTLRLYAPKPQVADGRWNPPAIRRIK